MLAQQRDAITELFAAALTALDAAEVAPVLERPRDPTHGDVACTVALQLAKARKLNPRLVAEQIVGHVRANPKSRALIDDIAIAGPGFINLKISASAKRDVVRAVLQEQLCFGTSSAHAGARVMVEFVSANPTGPLHLGHARQAALGDALANLLAAQGWQVAREFYYNDAGAQVATLATSVQLRARQVLGLAIDEAAVGYQGDYIAEIARDYLAQKTVAARDRAPVTANGDVDNLEAIGTFAVAYLRHEQDNDLAALGVRFDHYFLESSLYRDGQVEQAVAAMTQSGMTFEAEGALWLRTTAIGDVGPAGSRMVDDKDRVMRKSDGSYTYFVPDVAYPLSKWQRGFSKVINVQGSDHHGNVARVRAGLQAAAKSMGLQIPRDYPDYLLHKMLRVERGGEEVKMSKRAGTYVTLRDLLEWAGADATRFFLVARKADTEFTFDVDLARAQSDDNPVYYVQYAHARICSVFAQAAEKGFPFAAEAAGQIDLTPLASTRELALVQRLADYPDAIRAAADELAPHHVCFYLKDLAADFHAFYNAERVLVDEAPVRDARLSLLLATRQVLRNGLGVLGVSAPERM